MKPLLLYREADLIVPLTECLLEVASKSMPPFTDVEDLQVSAGSASFIE